MAGQQLVFAECITGMKKVLARYNVSDDDDAPPEIARSVQHKLKRKASRPYSILDNGGSVYKRAKIDHAGYERHIISRNPPLIDEDGDEVEPDLDDDDSIDGSLADENPYGDIRLEELLAPLTSAADLSTHPSMSIPYYSTHITELARNARDVLQKEQQSLWKAKSIFQKLLGDDTWLPVGAMETAYDREIINGPGFGAGSASGSFDGDDQERHGMGWEDLQIPDDNSAGAPAQPPGSHDAPKNTEDVQMTESDTNSARPNGTHAQHGEPHQNGATEEPAKDQPNAGTEDGVGHATNGEAKLTDQQNPAGGDKMEVDGSVWANGEAPDANHPPSEDGDETNSQNTLHRMTTRAQAHANSTSSSPNSPRLDSPASSAPFIHPLFQFPIENLVDRDMGLPSNEAEETRTWLLMYIQKQEEVVRQTRALYMGLMEADRKRKLVLKWTRAEGHVGEMSDGEDWVDKEEWGLTEDLVKGKEEEEEEGVVQGKKTRTRRRDEK
ncbi:RXT2-like protein [Phyllosticta capitalensis]|uniref:RXT2-like protein n=1 Tax=Phyllosticta capitalensis TaxID=121624 RepID=UPI0031318911